ncbi:glycosyltransferase family 4 protein [Halorarum salinum]|uniref:Glycosyltransferase family 4 protein n=1 Tax=Halorarum salinum TaxID=2743089 RepID=A0A7D5L8G5_9EURY|nr:glycosyltransferase family 4 protein [Halobaculum salinum]QLG60430.1 glycosyltransferase family 4 protein [Halobaculum salinum]
MHYVAVAHVDLMAKGGGEAVAMNVLEALQDDHDVTLLTLVEPDLETLNGYFRSDVTGVEVRTADRRRRLLDAVEGATGLTLFNLRNALLNRFVAAHADEFDAVVATDNELSVPGPLVQYVHTPRFARLVVSKRVGEDGFLDHAYDRLSYLLGGYDAERIRDSRLLTNSSWMADVVQDAYGVRPSVVHPPVDTRGFDPRPWDEREGGFLTVGRLAPYKNVEDGVRIVDRVRERGHDVHLHLVGPAYDRDYRERLADMAAERPHVSLEGEVSRERLVDLVCTHRYGLHGKRYEHFGMVVAEFVAGGALPFVPNDGGQRDVVDGRDELTYDTVDEAVERIDCVLSDPSLQRELLTDPGRVERRFGRDRFHREVRRAVAAGSTGDLSFRRGTP